MTLPEKEQRAFDRHPEDTKAFAALRAHLEREGAKPQLLALYERHAAALGGQRRAIDVLWSAAQLGKELGDSATEKRLLHKLLMIDEHRLALERSCEIARQEQDWLELVNHLTRQLISAEKGRENKRAARLHHELGELWETRFVRLDKAIAHYQAAFRAEPSRTEAIQAGREIYARIGHFKIVGDLYALQIQHARDAKSKVELLRALSKVQYEQLGDLEAAARALLEASKLQPGDDEILEQLGEIYASPEWPNPGGLERASGTFVQIAQRKQGRGDRDGAIAYLRRALGADPINAVAAGRLERIYRETGRWQDLDRLYRQRLSVATEMEAVELSLRRGELLERKLADRKGARECYEGLLAQEPIGGPAAARLRDLYRADEDYEALAKLYQRGVDLTNDRTARASLLFELALLQRDKLDNADEAARLLHDLLQVDPTHKRGLAEYEAYFRTRGDFRRLAELLSFSAHAAKERGASRVEVASKLEEITEIYERRLGDLPGALETWRDLASLSHDQGRCIEKARRIESKMRHFEDLARRYKAQIQQAVSPGEALAAKRDKARVFYEKNIDNLHTIDVLREIISEAPHDENAQQMLVDLYRREANDEGLAWILRARLDGILTREQRRDIIVELCELYQKRIKDDNQAIWAYRELLQIEPQNESAYDSLTALYEKTEDFASLAQLLDRWAQTAPDVEQRASALRKLSTIMSEQLDAPAKAAEHLEHLLSLVPDDSEALEKLADMLEKSGQQEQLVNVLMRRLEGATDMAPGDRIGLLRKVVDSTQKLGRTEQTIFACELIAEQLPADRKALEQLSRLYGEAGRKRDLAGVLERRIGLTLDPEEKVSIAFKWVDVLEALGDAQGAIAGYELLLSELAPNDLDAYRKLRQLLLNEGQSRRAAELAELELFVLPADAVEQRIELCRDLASLWWDRIQDAQRAVVAHERLLELLPEDRTALLTLRRLYHRVGAHHKLVEIAPAVFSALTDDNERRLFLIEMAELWERELGDPGQALDWYRRAYDLYPDTGDTLQRIERLARDYGMWEELIALLAQQRERATLPEDVLRLSQQIKDICVQELSSPDRAFAALKDGLHADPNGAALLPQIEQLATSAGMHRDLVAVYDQLMMTASADRRRELLRSKAEKCETVLRDTATALEVMITLYLDYERSGAVRDELLEEIERLAGLAHRWPRAVELHLRRLLRASEQERPALLVLVANRCQDRLKDPARSLDALLRALVLAPDDELIKEQLFKTAEQLQRSGRSARANLFADIDRQLVADEPTDVPQRAAAAKKMPPPTPPRPPLIIGSSKPRGDATQEIETDAIEVLSEEPQRGDATLELREGDAIEIRPLSAEVMTGFERVAAQSFNISSQKEIADPTLEVDLDAVAVADDEGFGLPQVEQADDPWQRIALALRMVAANQPNDEKRRRLIEIAELWVSRRRLEDACKALADAALLDLGHNEALDRLDQLGREQDALRLVFETHEELISLAQETVDALSLHLRSGMLRLENGLTDEAEKHLSQVVAYDPAHLEASTSLRSIFESAERWAPLADLLSRQLQALQDQLPDAEVLDRVAELADLYEHRLDSPLEAADYVSRLVEAHSRDATLVRRLADLFERVARWPRHVETLQKLLELVGTSEQTDVWLRLARVYEVELELPHRAIEAYQRALDIAPADTAALDGLHRLYARHHQVDQLIQTLQRRASVAAEADEERALRLQVADLLQNKGQLDAAIAEMSRARELGPSEPALDQRLLGALIATQRISDAITFQQDRLQLAKGSSASPETLATLLTELADLYERSGDAHAMRDALEASLSLCPGLAPALEKLCHLHIAEKNWDGYVDVITRLAHLEKRAGALGKLIHGAAMLASVGATSQALELYERVREHDPDNLDAIDGLVLLKQEDPEAQLYLLQQRRRVIGPQGEDANLLVRIASLQLELGREPEEMIPLLQSAVSLAPSHVAALDMLSDLMLRVDRTIEARRLLEQAIDNLQQAGTPREAARLHFRLGRIFDTDDSEGAYRQYLEAVRLQPKDLELRLALGENRFAAGRWREALRHLGETAQHPDAPRFKVAAAAALYHAALCERRLRRADRAPALLEAAYQLDPDHPEVLEELAAFALDQRVIDRAAKLLRRLANITEAPQQKLEVLVGVLRLCLDEPGQQEETYACAKELYGVWHKLPPPPPGERPDDDPRNLAPQLLQRALPFFRDAKDHATAAELATRLADASGSQARSPEAARDLLLDAADDFQAAGDWVRADECRKRILQLDPDCEPATIGLALSEEAQGRPQEAVTLLEEFVRSRPIPKDAQTRRLRAELYTILARLFGGLGQLDRAIAAMERRVSIQEDEKARHKLAELYKQQPKQSQHALANHRVLARNIENVDSLRALAAASAASAQYRAYCIYRTLEVMGQIDDRGQQFLSEYTPPSLETHQTYGGEFSDADRAALLTAPGAVMLREVFKALYDASSVLLNRDLVSDYQVTTEMRVSPVEKTDLARVFTACSRALGLKATALYRLDGPAADSIKVTATARPALLVPANIAEDYPAARLRFALGRALELTQPDAIFAASMDRSEFAQMLTAVLRAFHPRHMRRRGLTEGVRDLAEHYRKSFPYRVTRRLGDLFREHPQQSFDSGAWRQAVMMSANRAGLVLCGDVQVAMHQLRKEDPALDGIAAFPDAIRQSPFVRDLLTFAASDSFYVCRVKLGMAKEG
jgi:tetratricopeptide (TPR) repeat protein